MFQGNRRQSTNRQFGMAVDWDQALMIAAVVKLVKKCHPRIVGAERDSLFQGYIQNIRGGIHPRHKTIKIIHEGGHILIDLDGCVIEDTGV